LKIRSASSLVLLVIAFQFVLKVSVAQLQQNYYPLKAYSSSSEVLLSILQAQFNQEFAQKSQEVKKIISKREDYLINQVKRSAFIQNDSLEEYIASVIKNIVNTNPSIPRRIRTILITKNPIVNAACFGKGIYIVNIGLLARITTEDQLAFTLAHEIAHDELNHIIKKIEEEAEIKMANRTKEQIKKIVTGKIELEDIEDYRKVIYGISRYSREMEMQADSMAIALLGNTHYDKNDAFSMFDILDLPFTPNYPFDEDVFIPFHTERFPFQLDWLNERPSVLSRKNEGNFMIWGDSIRSHPTMELRKEKLSNLIRAQDGTINTGRRTLYSANFTDKMEFETVESCYFQKRYDWCLFHALQLLRRYPKNQYLVAMIGRIFIDLYKAKNENVFQTYVSLYTINYSPELRLVNNFLFNLSTKELGELCYYFITNENHFNTGNPYHCYLIWEISEQTYRFGEAKKISSYCKKQFNRSIQEFAYNDTRIELGKRRRK